MTPDVVKSIIYCMIFILGISLELGSWDVSCVETCGMKDVL